MVVKLPQGEVLYSRSGVGLQCDDDRYPGSYNGGRWCVPEFLLSHFATRSSHAVRNGMDFVGHARTNHVCPNPSSGAFLQD
jgi:hypothetical protein